MRSTTRTRPLIAAAAVLLIAVTSACTGGSDPTPTPTLDPAPSGAASDSGGAPTPSSPSEDDGEPIAGECKAAEGDEKLPTEAPPVDTWEDVAGLGVPTSNTYGPYVQEGALWTCYEHSPVGAVFAATYVFAAMGQVDGFAEAWIPEGEFRDLVADQEKTSTDPTEGTLTPVAFKVVSYTDDKSIVEVVTKYANSDGNADLSMRFALHWNSNRWMVDAEDSSKDFTPVESLDGYTKWGSDG